MVIYLKDFFLCTLLYTAKKSFFVSDSFSKFLAAVLLYTSPAESETSLRAREGVAISCVAVRHDAIIRQHYHLAAIARRSIEIPTSA